MKKLLYWLVPLIALPFSTTAAGRWDPCVNHFPGIGSYKRVADARLENIANDLVARFGVNETPIICAGAPDAPFDVVLTQPISYKNGAEKYLLIAFDAHFLNEFHGPVEALLAHEIAHSVTPDGKICGKMPYAAHMVCEADVDYAASLVVGEFTMVRAYERVREYLLTYKSHVRGINDILDGFRIREELLRKARVDEKSE